MEKYASPFTPTSSANDSPPDYFPGRMIVTAGIPSSPMGLCPLPSFYSSRQALQQEMIQEAERQQKTTTCQGTHKRTGKRCRNPVFFPDLSPLIDEHTPQFCFRHLHLDPSSPVALCSFPNCKATVSKKLNFCSAHFDGFLSSATTEKLLEVQEYLETERRETQEQLGWFPASHSMYHRTYRRMKKVKELQTMIKHSLSTTTTTPEVQTEHKPVIPLHSSYSPPTTPPTTLTTTPSPTSPRVRLSPLGIKSEFQEASRKRRRMSEREGDNEQQEQEEQQQKEGRRGKGGEWIEIEEAGFQPPPDWATFLEILGRDKHIPNNKF